MPTMTSFKSTQKICHIFHNNSHGGQQDSFSVMESDSQCWERPLRFIPHNGFYGMFLASIFSIIRVPEQGGGAS
jgi:hypothetical protein